VNSLEWHFPSLVNVPVFMYYFLMLKISALFCKVNFFMLIFRENCLNYPFSKNKRVELK